MQLKQIEEKDFSSYKNITTDGNSIKWHSQTLEHIFSDQNIFQFPQLCFEKTSLR